MNSNIKKQNRVLLATLVVLLCAAVVLIAVTGSANRKAKAEQNPDNSQNLVETVPEESSAKKSPAADPNTSRKRDNKSSDPDTVKKDKSDTSDKTKDSTERSSTVETEQNTAEVAAMQSEPLPTFSAPVDNFVIKECSLDTPVFSYTMNDHRIHNGVDIACSVGTPVLAAADGVVCEVYSDPMMGMTVGIEHSGGAVTRYKGLSEDSADLVRTGDLVKRGQVIAASGETALIESAEEAHVHFELSINGEPADPAEYMKLSRLSEVYEG